ncbi:platelet glycoprotein V-like [Strongylocentrotus purpuratus]|uniref:TIR domain-containing protein n=1 Tax=Strongylocentrotus purpuratus TaxID=7668 RepID=A0A7M7NPQ3_STRPU|nr:platelet glycoprotein V-like [Strongylocentrotus purpuratus]
MDSLTRTLLILIAIFLGGIVQKNIPGYALRGFAKLQVLNLQGNRIYSINKESFCGLHSLVDLSLFQNRLTSLPRAAFACASNLRKINLSRNKLATLDPQWFDGSLFLRSLVIDQSTIGRIKVGPWKATNLQTLVLSKNNIGFLNSNSFTGLANLKTLDVSGNGDRLRMSEDALTSVGSLEFLVMADMEKFSMTGSFRNMQNLLHLDISYSLLKISSIDQFTNTSGLRVLNMTESYLKAEDLVGKHTGTSLFSGLVSLQILELQKNDLNNLHDFPGIFTPLGSLVELDLTSCRIQHVASGTFANLTTLQLLSLTNNDLTSIPKDAFQGLHHLRVLQLQYNSIAFIEQGLFMGTNELERLYLQNNHILTIATNTLAIVGYHEITEDRTPEDYEYQLNLMFHDDEEWWVNDFMKPFLEQRMPHLERVIFGDADLHPGLFYLNAIYDVIENGHKTILLLSNQSFDDTWYMTKLRMAVEHMNDTKLEKVILIFLEDIDDDHLPYLVRLLLSRNKPYLLWTEDEEGQEVFWAKVQKSMRSNRQMNNVIPI